MLDLSYFRQNLETVAKQLATRGYNLDVALIDDLEAQRKSAQAEVDTIRNERNTASKKIGQAKAKGEDVQLLLDAVSDLGDKLKQADEALTAVKNQLDAIYWTMPNIPHQSVPVGKDEDDNQQVRTHGDPKTFDFTPLTHEALAADLMDFPLAAKLSGARFVVLKGAVSRLHRALAQFMLDLHTQQHGYLEINGPLLVKPECMQGTGQLPKFEDDQFFVNDERDFALIPTAEVTLTNFVRDEIIPIEQLPIKLVAHSACFRKEAGAYGKDTQGMIRQHQFEKVELVQIVHPDHSYEALESLTQDAARVLELLELPYRVMSLCTGDMGLSAAKTYDLEVWLPGQQRYREISSCSNTEAYQARRMKARYRCPQTNKPALVHTLNGSGLAVGRTLIALLENHQTAQKTIMIPKALQPYVGGETEISLI